MKEDFFFLLEFSFQIWMYRKSNLYWSYLYSVLPLKQRIYPRWGCGLTGPASKLANSSQNCHDVATHCDTLSICTALYHCLHKEQPHICSANSLPLMQQPRGRSALFPCFWALSLNELFILFCSPPACFPPTQCYNKKGGCSIVSVYRVYWIFSLRGQMGAKI